MNWKRKFAIVAVPTVLALAGGSVVVLAAPSPNPPDPASTTTSGTEPAEAPETAAEKVEANEPNLPGGGHADNPADANADHQLEGIE